MSNDIRSPDIKEKARQMYKDGMLLKDIATELGKADSTIRSWKNRYKWDGNKSATLQKKKEKKVQRCSKKKEIPKEVEYVVDNKELTDKEALFCIYYVKSFNATQSYKKAYECAYSTSMVEGSKLLRNPKIELEIKRLKAIKYTNAYFGEEDIFQKYMDIAFADITDYVDFGTEEVKVDEDENGNAITMLRSYVRFKEGSEVDGSIVSEIKVGRDGASIKLNDRMTALKWLSDHMGLANEKQKAEIELIKSKVQTTESTEDKMDKYFEAIKDVFTDDKES